LNREDAKSAKKNGETPPDRINRRDAGNAGQKKRKAESGNPGTSSTLAAGGVGIDTVFAIMKECFNSL